MTTATGVGGGVVRVINMAAISSSSSSSTRPSQQPPLNPLGQVLISYLWEQIGLAELDASVVAVVITGGGGGGGDDDPDGTGGMGEGHFSAGADLTELQGVVQALPPVAVVPPREEDPTSTPTLNDLLHRIENMNKPVVAAIRGACLGGGLELALSCHYRIALHQDATTRLGLPEVLVGLIPGAGGTQRLPRLIGLVHACEMILTGSSISAQKAYQWKLIDDLVDDPRNTLQRVSVGNSKNHSSSDGDIKSASAYQVLMDKAIRYAEWASVMPLEDRRIGQRPVRESPAEAHVILHVTRLQIPNNDGNHGLILAWKAIQAAVLAPSFQDGMDCERELFIEALLSEQGQARRHVFFAVRTAQRPFVDVSSSTTANTKPPSHDVLMVSRTITSANNNNTAAAAATIATDVTHNTAPHVAVVGAGLMGSGIALVLLQAGYVVYLVDVAQDALDRGVKFIHDTLQSWTKKGKLSKSAMEQLVTHRLRSTLHLQDLHSCVLVVEAVLEKLDLKQSIFLTLDQVTPKDALLVTNTSTLDVDAIGQVLPMDRRSRFAGWHFFSPAHVMKLVEIVRGSSTSTDTIAILQALSKRVGKTAVVVGNCDGFCGNRLLKPYSAETALLLVEPRHHPTNIEHIDQALVAFGMALGPFQMSDLAGNDVGYYIRQERGWTRPNKTASIPVQRPARYTELADDLVTQLGRKGQKVGKGWYDYNPLIEKGRKPLPSAEVRAFLQQYREDAQTTTSTMVNETSGGPLTSQEIIERVLYPLVNEGFKCLEEGIARCPSDIDVVYVYGYGWPVWRGGPMYWADHDVGLPLLLDKLNQLSRRFPTTEHFVPSQLLRNCVQQGLTVEEYYRTRQNPNSRL